MQSRPPDERPSRNAHGSSSCSPRNARAEPNGAARSCGHLATAELLTASLNINDRLLKAPGATGIEQHDHARARLASRIVDPRDRLLRGRRELPRYIFRRSRTNVRASLAFTAMNSSGYTVSLDKNSTASINGDSLIKLDPSRRIQPDAN